MMHPTLMYVVKQKGAESSDYFLAFSDADEAIDAAVDAGVDVLEYRLVKARKPRITRIMQ